MLEKSYQPQTVEPRISELWEGRGAFRCGRPERADAEPFTIVIPPPNVTGALHMGHALNNFIQDLYIRRARMGGKNACWVPGADHAGIATQNVVEKELLKEGKRKEDLGREAFVKRVWEWKERYGSRIREQLKRLGSACDWERERFTLDEGLSKAVTEVFVRLYEKGRVYRDQALVNWCPRCRTTLSNEECPAVEEEGRFWDLHYPLTDDPDRMITVSTTRPETMLGDTAVAVHPDDERYAALVGKTVTLPLMNREIPIVTDGHADPEKGSGAVKITPAHDFDDFEVSKRHDLPRVRVIDEGGRMTEETGPYAGLDRFEARERVAADLKELGLLGEIESRTIPLPRCYRCDTIVEPNLSTQWFVKMRPLLEPAARAITDGTVRIVPDRYAKLYLEWVEKYIDWPISRQLWWGHRIPVWYCGDCDETIVAREAPGACPACSSSNLAQDEDVLDTWFSSQLWPFSVQGWPEPTEDLDYFYPTDLLVTDRGIIYFWVARMVMAGLEFMGREPFPTVYIHGTILDETGRRMSKSLGNGIDPIEMIDIYGADAVRFSLAMLCSEGQDIKLAESRFEKGRNFANKLWNASRFAMMNLDTDEQTPAAAPAEDLAFEDRWILHRLQRTISRTSRCLDEYRIDDAANGLYDFVWRDFCDWYLELVKPRLHSGGDAAARRTLADTLGTILELMHPFVPFVTDEIHENLGAALGEETAPLARSAWPKADDARIDEETAREMETLQAVIRSIRNVRAEMNVPETARPPLTVSAADEDGKAMVLRHADRIAHLAKLERIEAGVGLPKPGGAAAAVVGDLELFLTLGDVIDVDAEIERLRKESDKLEKAVRGSERKLQNRDFLEKAPAEIVDREKSKRDDLASRLEAVRKHVESLEDLRE